MKISCGVIRDLLPLYAEQITGEESRALVEEHLAGCPDCRSRLEKLREPAAPEPDSAEALRGVSREIRRRRIRTALLAALLVFLPLFALLARGMEEQYLPYTEGLVRVEGVEHYSRDESFPAQRAEGYFPQGGEPDEGEGLVITFNGWVTGLESEYDVDDETGETTLFLQAWTHRINLLIDDTAGGKLSLETPADLSGRTMFFPVPDRVIYGFGEKQTLLYGEEMNGGMQVLPRLALSFYLLLSLGAAAAFGLLWLLLRKKKAAPALRGLFFAAISYPVGHLLVKGTQTVSFFLPRDLTFILIAAAAVWGLLMLGWTILRQTRQEKA